MRLVITGGGTGGHTSPAVAVYEELLKRDPRLHVLWLGRAGAIEHRICAKLNIPFRSLPVEGWPRKRSLRRIVVAAKLGWSIARAWLYLRNFAPDVVFGVGGYVSLPAMLVAPRMGIPTVLHEQNRLLGVTNRLAARRAARVFLSFDQTVGDFPRDRAVVVGNPVRASFLNPPPREDACREFGLDPTVPVVLVSGGSQGAASINNAVAAALPLFRENELQLIWMTGQNDVARARAAAQSARIPVQVHPFIDSMATACAAADLVVSRAGASTTAELAVLRKPSILVPFPHATDNHQEHNARGFADAGAAVMLLDSELSGDKLAALVRELLGDPRRLSTMRAAAATLAKPEASDTIAHEILALAFADATLVA